MASLAWRLHGHEAFMPHLEHGSTREARHAHGRAISVVFGLCASCHEHGAILGAAGGDSLNDARPRSAATARDTRVMPPGSETVEPYPLDGLVRTLGERTLSCPEVELADHHGNNISFTPAARAVQPFVSRLVWFEQVVDAVARRFYGRAPSELFVAASYGCRSVGGEHQRLSEHALGNAIDVSGFAFAESPGWPDNATPLPSAFEVWVEQHWKNAGDPAIERHARFLEALTAELVERRVFRTLLGPSHPDHADHFHFDMAPSGYVHL